MERREEILLRCVNDYANESNWGPSLDTFKDIWIWEEGVATAKQALADLKALEEK
jgi:hypothetical protein